MRSGHGPHHGQKEGPHLNGCLLTLGNDDGQLVGAGIRVQMSVDSSLGDDAQFDGSKKTLLPFSGLVLGPKRIVDGG